MKFLSRYNKITMFDKENWDDFPLGFYLWILCPLVFKKYGSCM